MKWGLVDVQMVLIVYMGVVMIIGIDVAMGLTVGVLGMGHERKMGVGAVVLEETKIPPRTIVTGIPAKPRGSIQPRHETLIKETAERYVESCKEYKDEGLE